MEPRNKNTCSGLETVRARGALKSVGKSFHYAPLRRTVFWLALYPSSPPSVTPRQPVCLKTQPQLQQQREGARRGRSWTRLLERAPAEVRVRTILRMPHKPIRPVSGPTHRPRRPQSLCSVTSTGIHRARSNHKRVQTRVIPLPSNTRPLSALLQVSGLGQASITLKPTAPPKHWGFAAPSVSSRACFLSPREDTPHGPTPRASSTGRLFKSLTETRGEDVSRQKYTHKHTYSREIHLLQRSKNTQHR